MLITRSTVDQPTTRPTRYRARAHRRRQKSECAGAREAATASAPRPQRAWKVRSSVGVGRRRQAQRDRRASESSSERGRRRKTSCPWRTMGTTPLTRCGWRRRVATGPDPVTTCEGRADNFTRSTGGSAGHSPPPPRGSVHRIGVPRPSRVVRRRQRAGPAERCTPARLISGRAEVDGDDVEPGVDQSRAPSMSSSPGCRGCPWSPNSARWYAAANVAPAPHGRRRRLTSDHRRNVVAEAAVVDDGAVAVVDADAVEDRAAGGRAPGPALASQPRRSLRPASTATSRLRPAARPIGPGCWGCRRRRRRTTPRRPGSTTRRPLRSTALTRRGVSSVTRSSERPEGHHGTPAQGHDRRRRPTTIVGSAVGAGGRSHGRGSSRFGLTVGESEISVMARRCSAGGNSAVRWRPSTRVGRALDAHVPHHVTS